MRRIVRWLALALMGLMASCVGRNYAYAQSCVVSSQVTLSGTLRASNGLPSSNDVITLTPSQVGIVAGCGVNVVTTNTCATSTDGSVVGMPNPLSAITASTTFTGTLPANTYYVEITFYDAAGNETLVSPETIQQLSAQGSLVVNAPFAGIPSAAVGMRVYIGTTSGGETLQGTTVGTASYNRSTPLASGTNPPASNTTLCKITANDSIWPTGTGYVVGMTDSSGNAMPGYPMQWQLMGAGTTINLSNGLPYYHGVVMYPSPILASPPAHGQQSITGPVNFGGYNVTNVGKVGVGTSLPAWPVDVRNGFISSNLGYLINGQSGTSGQCLLSGGASGPMTWGNCLVTPPTVYYQTFKFSNVAATQAAVVNFSPRFTFTNGSNVTNVDLNAPGTGAMVATLASAPGATTQFAAFDGNGNLAPTALTPGGTDYWWQFDSCSMAAGQPSGCAGTTTLPGAMPDATYFLECTTNSNGTPKQAVVVNFAMTLPLPTASGATLSYLTTVVEQNGGGGQTAHVWCHAHHN